MTGITGGRLEQSGSVAERSLGDGHRGAAVRTRTRRSAGRVRVRGDPLIETYLSFRDRWLATAHRAGRSETDAHPIGSCRSRAGSFDTLVMINPRRADADRCLEVVTGLLRPGGTLVLGQD